MLFLKKLVVVFVVLTVTFPGVSELNEPSISRNPTDYRAYVLDNLLFLKNIETKSAGDDLEIKSGTDYLRRRKKLFAPSNTALLKDVFENNQELSDWMRKSAGPLFSAIQADNVDMIRFFEQRQGSVLLKKYGELYAVQLAVIVPSLNAIRYFFNHSAIDLSVVNMFGDNLFHLIFLGSGTANSKLAVLRMFLHDTYFPKVAHLLNKPNFNNETPLDSGLKEEKTVSKEKMILSMLKKEAVALTETELLRSFEGNRSQVELLVEVNNGRDNNSRDNNGREKKPGQESKPVTLTVDKEGLINVSGMLMTEQELEEHILRNRALDRETVRLLEEGIKKKREERERNDSGQEWTRSTCRKTF